MAINHIGKLHIGRQALPLEARAPVLEESPRPALALVVPELAEGLLEQVKRGNHVTSLRAPSIFRTSAIAYIPVGIRWLAF